MKLSKKEKDELKEKEIKEILAKVENNKNPEMQKIKITKKEISILRIYRIEQQKNKAKEEIKEIDIKIEKKIKNNLSKLIQLSVNKLKLDIFKDHKSYFLIWGILKEISKKSQEELEIYIKKGEEDLFINNLENPTLKTEKEEE